MKATRVCFVPAGQLLLLGALLTTSAFGQTNTPFLDAMTPRSTHFAHDFGVEDVRGQFRLYGKAGLEATVSDGVKFSAVGGAALDVHILGAMREALALEVKHETKLLPGTGATRARSNAVGSAEEFEARSSGPHETNRARSNAVGSREEFDARAEAPVASVPGLKKTVRLCGFTVQLASPKDRDENGKMAPKNLVPGGVKKTILVGPVPVLIAFNAGVGLDLGVDPFLEVAGDGANRHKCFGIEGGIGVSLNGWVIGGVGGGCRFASAVAGIKGDLKLMKFGTGLRLGYDSMHGLIVGAFYKLQPAVLKVLAIAYCEVGVGRFKLGKKFEYLLYEWKAEERRGTLPVTKGQEQPSPSPSPSPTPPCGAPVVPADQ